MLLQVINLVVKDQSGNEVHFKVKTHTKLEKVRAVWSECLWRAAGSQPAAAPRTRSQDVVLAKILAGQGTGGLPASRCGGRFKARVEPAV